LVITPTGVDGLSGLSRLGIPVLTLEPSSIAGIYHDILLVGEATAHTRRALQLIRQLKAETATISGEVRREATYHPRVFLDLGGLYTAGPRSFIAALIHLAGGINVGNQMSTEAYPKVTAEQVVRANPSIIVVDPEGTSVAQEEKIAGFSAIQAVKTHHVFAMPQPSYVDEPSPGFVCGIRELAQLFYPKERFPMGGNGTVCVEP
jgi:iron complex transport system substrate-binding protein